MKLDNTAGPTPPKVIPKCMVINARSLAKPGATSALYADLHSNKIDICFVSETWLNNKIRSHLICPDGYTISRKDRSDERNGGGVAIICRSDWRIKQIKPGNEFECIWCEIATPNSEFFVATLYHPPDPVYKASDLLDFLSDCCEEILLSNPNSKITIAGDINQLDIKDLTRHHAIQQIVKAPTRGQKTLDVFLTNCPLYWKTPSEFQGLVRSDHLAVLVLPRITSKPIRKFVYSRDVREHRKIEMERKLADFDWSSVSTNADLCESVRLFNGTLMTMFNDCFPLKKVKVSSRDPPYMSPLVKHLCNIRNKNIRNFKSADNFILQERINKLIRETKFRLSKMKTENSLKEPKAGGTLSIR